MCIGLLYEIYYVASFINPFLLFFKETEIVIVTLFMRTGTPGTFPV